MGILKGSSSILGKASSTTNQSLQKLAPKDLDRTLPKVVTRRLLLSVVGVGLSTLGMLIDMAHEFDTGDYDAAFACGVSALGCVMIMVTLPTLVSRSRFSN